jgi:broad specificity phosphatase PhoE
MPELLFVRHGQGGPTAENYDALSPLGWQQAERLGRWLLAHGRDFGHLAVGRLRRQRETLDAVRRVYAAAGRRLPEVEEAPELDEYRFTDLVQAFARHAPGHPALAAARALPNDKRHWIRLLRTTLTAWAAGELAAAPESWASFQARARSALHRYGAAARTQAVLVVSSGGVMSQVAQAVLGLPDPSAIELNLGLLNTGLCSYRVSESGIRLAAFNALPHLAAPEDRPLWTLV